MVCFCFHFIVSTLIAQTQSYKYSDSSSSVLIVFTVPPSTKKQDLDIGFNSNSLRVGLKGGTPICEGQVRRAKPLVSRHFLCVETRLADARAQPRCSRR